jgi:hypothetical protein
MLHSDGQYEPKNTPRLLKPILAGECDISQWSRDSHLKGGMPIYKSISNHILKFFEELVFRYGLKEYNSGFRVYSSSALSKLPLDQLSNDHIITAQIVALSKLNKLTIKDIPIQTHYYDSASSLSFFRSLLYGISVFGVLINYLLALIGLSVCSLYHVDPSKSERIIKLNKIPKS